MSQAWPGPRGRGSIRLISREPAAGRLGPCFSVSFGTPSAGRIVYDERDKLLKQEPVAEPYVRPFSMRAEYINGIPHYCLWMDGADPAALLKLPLVRERLGRVHEIRLQSKKAATQKLSLIHI